MITSIKAYFKQRTINRKRRKLHAEQFEINMNIIQLRAFGFSCFERGEKRIKEINKELTDLSR